MSVSSNSEQTVIAVTYFYQTLKEEERRDVCVCAEGSVSITRVPSMLTENREKVGTRQTNPCHRMPAVYPLHTMRSSGTKLSADESRLANKLKPFIEDPSARCGVLKSCDF